MISIIVPFYNTEKYLEECLSSIKAQTFSDFELFMMLVNASDKEVYQTFLPNIDFSDFGIYNKQTSENGEKVKIKGKWDFINTRKQLWEN